jgi:hypothetical protein
LSLQGPGGGEGPQLFAVHDALHELGHAPFALPSSHCSPLSRTLLPHMGWTAQWALVLHWSDPLLPGSNAHTGPGKHLILPPPGGTVLHEDVSKLHPLGLPGG